MQLLLAFLAGAAVVGLWAFWKINQLKLENVRLQERKNALDQTQTNQEKLFNTLQKQAQDSFKQLAAESLKAQKEELVTKNKDLFTPIKETMDRFTTEMGHLRTEAAQRHGSLQTALDQTKALNEKLSKEANDLTTALKNPKTQGTWGEIILEDVLTSMGLREGVEFEKQVSFKTDQGDRQQPDFIVHLPQQRDLIIDSKMSLNSYTKWANETNETEKRKLLKEHTRAVEEHIKELAAKDYPKLLKNEKRGILSVLDDDGYPYGMSMNHYYSSEDGTRENDSEWVLTVRSVIVFGKIDIIDDPDKTSEISTELSHKFTQDEEYIAREIELFAKATLLLRLTPEHICSKRVIES